MWYREFLSTPSPVTSVAKSYIMWYMEQGHETIYSWEISCTLTWTILLILDHFYSFSVSGSQLGCYILTSRGCGISPVSSELCWYLKSGLVLMAQKVVKSTSHVQCSMIHNLGWHNMFLMSRWAQRFQEEDRRSGATLNTLHQGHVPASRLISNDAASLTWLRQWFLHFKFLPSWTFFHAPLHWKKSY